MSQVQLKSNLSNYLKLVLVVILHFHRENKSPLLLMLLLDILSLLLEYLLLESCRRALLKLLERGLERQMLLNLNGWHIFSFQTFRSGMTDEVSILLICTKGELLWTDGELVLLSSYSSFRCALLAELR